MKKLILLPLFIISYQNISAQDIVNFEELIYDDYYSKLDSSNFLTKQELSSLNTSIRVLHIDNDLFYPIDSLAPFNGIARDYRKNKTIKWEYEIENGQIKSVSHYNRKNTIRHKDIMDSLGQTLERYHYYKNGNILDYYEMKNGVSNGLYKYYYEDGTLGAETTYLNGKKHGTSYSYNKDGTLCMETNYKNGKKHGKEICYCPNSDEPNEVTEYMDGKKVKK